MNKKSSAKNIFEDILRQPKGKMPPAKPKARQEPNLPTLRDSVTDKASGDMHVSNAVYRQIEGMAKRGTKVAEAFIAAYASKISGSVEEMRALETPLMDAIMNTAFAGGNPRQDIQSAIHLAIGLLIEQKTALNPRLCWKMDPHAAAVTAKQTPDSIRLR